MKKVFIFIIVLLVFLTVGILAVEQVLKNKIKGVEISQELVAKAQQSPNETVKVIIVFNKKPKGYKNFIKNLGNNSKIIYDYNIINGVAVSLPAGLVQRLEGMKNIISIQEDREVHTFLSESIPIINADNVHSLGYNGSGKSVCVVDTGVDDSHSALNPLIAEHCYCSVNPPGPATGCCPNGQIEDTDATDDEGHGTHVAGIIASQNETYKGTSPGIDLMAVKVLDSSGSGFESDIIKGIEWCSDQSADIISMSLGGGLFTSNCDSEADATAVNNAVDKGSVVVVASGNDASTTSISSPACASKAISVGATYDANIGSVSWGSPIVCSDSTTFIDKIVCFTNRNAILDLLAPGSVTTSLKLGGGFTDKSGTSMATPHVSGVAALLLQKDPALNPAQIELILKNTGVNITDSDTGLIFPRIDALAAINLLPIGHLEPYLITQNKNATKGKFFNFSSGVRCVGGNCGNVSAILDPAAIFCETSPCVATSTLIKSRDNIAGQPESNQPNTIDSCADGTSGTYLTDESIENITITNLDRQGVFKISDKVRIDITAHCWTGGPTSDNVNFVYTNNSISPLWRVIGAISSCPAGGFNTFSKTFNLDKTEGNHTVRGLIEFNGATSDTCGIGNFDDNDDLTIFVSAEGIKGIIPMNNGTPFYTTSFNPQNSSNLACLQNMKAGDSCNQTWQVNATGNINTTWEFFTIYESDSSLVEKNETFKVNIKIVETLGEFISITLFGFPIDFAGQDPNTVDNPGTNNPYTVRIDPETTVNVDLYQKGEDFTGNPSTLGITNMSWLDSNNSITSNQMLTTFQNNISNISSGTNISSYYWLDIPTNQTGGSYNTTITIKAVKTGTLP
ncbi:MAG: S8 family serine peptidase [Candidatus Nanoarchaeia archaeon]